MTYKTTILNIKRRYCRLGHFREVLNQHQGKECKDIPAHVIEKVKAEIETKPMTIKQALRKLNMTKYVENCMYIDFLIKLNKLSLANFVQTTLLNVYANQLKVHKLLAHNLSNFVTL